MRRDIDMVEFWRPENKEILRKSRYIFDPSTGLEEIREAAKAQKQKQTEESKPASSEDQMSMDFD